MSTPEPRADALRLLDQGASVSRFHCGHIRGDNLVRARRTSPRRRSGSSRLRRSHRTTATKSSPVCTMGGNVRRTRSFRTGSRTSPTAGPSAVNRRHVVDAAGPASGCAPIVDKAKSAAQCDEARSLPQSRVHGEKQVQQPVERRESARRRSRPSAWHHLMPDETRTSATSRSLDCWGFKTR